MNLPVIVNNFFFFFNISMIETRFEDFVNRKYHTSSLGTILFKSLSC